MVVSKSKNPNKLKTSCVCVLPYQVQHFSKYFFFAITFKNGKKMEALFVVRARSTYMCTAVLCIIMVVVREILFPLQNYNVVALTYIAAKTNIV